MALIGVAGIAEYLDGNNDVGGLVFSFALAVGGGFFGFRGFRASATLSENGLLKRGLMFSRELPWTDIVDVEVATDYGLLNWRVPELWLTSGKSVRLHEVAQLRAGPGRVTELVKEVERRAVAVRRAAAAGHAGDER